MINDDEMCAVCAGLHYSCWNPQLIEGSTYLSERVVVAFEDYIGLDDSERVLFEIAVDGQISTQRMDPMADGYSFTGNYHVSQLLIQALHGATSLAFSVADRDGEMRSVRFGLAGSSSAVKEANRLCRERLAPVPFEEGPS